MGNLEIAVKDALEKVESGGIVLVAGDSFCHIVNHLVNHQHVEGEITMLKGYKESLTVISEAVPVSKLIRDFEEEIRRMYVEEKALDLSKKKRFRERVFGKKSHTEFGKRYNKDIALRKWKRGVG